MKNLARAIPLVLILLGPMAMLYPLWSNPTSAGEDDVIFYYPLRKMVGEALREGRWPLRNPHEAGGAPIFADPQSAVMYPPTWLFAVLAPKLAYSVSIFLAFSLAGGGAYAYLRRLGMLRGAALFGAAAFMFCGFMVGHRVHLSVIHTGAWLPWGLWCIEGLRRSRRAGIRAACGMVAVAFMAIAAGHWPTLIHVGLLWFVYLLVRPGAPGLWRAVLLAGGALVLAAVIAAPQLLGTFEVMGQVTRRRIGLQTAGENSFFPVAGVLAFFPMLMGSRWPNFFSQRWWGPWHLCEMLGYVGLVTLPLAAGAIVALRKRGPADGPGDCDPRACGRADPEAMRGVVRLWTWLAVGAGVWMLGYYLPTYRLIHMIPVIGVVRCPARMVVVVDLALATLAAAAIHSLCSGNVDASGLLGRSIRRCVTVVLPIVMGACLVLLALAAWAVMTFLGWGGWMPFPMEGGAWDVLKSVNPLNPAVWVQVALLAATILVVRFWLAAPARRTGVLAVLLLADLFFITRFVDVPGGPGRAPDPDVSPAAAWLKKNAPPDVPYCVWPLGRHYHDRPAELLLPKTAHALGVATINSYGPFQSPRHSHVLGFRIFGTARNWRWLIRENRLLSLYNVRYIVAADPKFRDALEAGAGPPRAFGESILTGNWQLDGATQQDARLTMRTGWLWGRASAFQAVRVRAGATYRISLQVRGSEGGAAGRVRAEVHPDPDAREGARKQAKWDYDATRLVVYPEQIPARRDWRRFEWTFQIPRAAPAARFTVSWSGDGSVEVRNIELRAAGDAPTTYPHRETYRKVAELSALHPGDPPVAIYENLRCRPGISPRPEESAEDTERFKWDAAAWTAPPDVSIAPGTHPRTWLTALTLPGLAVYAGLLLLTWLYAVGAMPIRGAKRSG